MRNIISEITNLWEICRKEQKSSTTSSPSPSPVLNQNESTWRPWVCFI